MAKKQKWFNCVEDISWCKAQFISQRGLNQHIRIKHPYIPPPPPKKTTKEFMRTGEEHRLIDGAKLKLGDRVGFSKSGVITKITLTEGSDLAVVEVAVITDSWLHE